MSNPFADLVIGNIGHVYSDFESKEFFQAMTRSMSERSKYEESSQQEADEAWKKDSFNNNTSESTTITDGTGEEIFSADDLVFEQRNDVSLKKVRELAKGPVNISRNAYFYEKNNILYRAFQDKSDGVVNQIVVPVKYRRQLMQVAHDIPFGGHMGNRKTRKSLLQNFFWPGMFKDIAEYCRSCPQCQRSVAKGKARKARLISIPPICEQFARVGIDIVGPLNRTQRGHRYILTLLDYGTKYPEAIPLKSIDTATVAEALLGIFSRVGIPKEILSDQASNFTSALMQELCKLLHVKKLKNTPYHPEANGLVERFIEPSKEC